VIHPWGDCLIGPARSSVIFVPELDVLTAPTAKSTTDLAVSATNLTKQFGQRVVVDSLDLAIPTGSVCGFVGPNGAGKTTTIRMLLGLIRPTAGTGTVLGGDLEHPETYLHKVGALIESPAFYPQLSGKDNLLALARLGGINPLIIATVLERVGLLHRATDSYRSYSLGMKQRLGIAAAMLASPDLLILDEPTNGLDPAGIVEMRDLIRSLADEGITVFVSSHLLAEIEHICDHLVMISDGKTVFQGEVAGLRANRGTELVLRPESAVQLPVLTKLVQQAGFGAHTENVSLGVDVVVADAGTQDAAALNRLAMNADVTLIHIAERTRSLEEAFFELTGSHSRDTGATHSLGGIK
jgi:ABC-2 type transport system ATP-binding protein